MILFSQVWVVSVVFCCADRDRSIGVVAPVDLT